MIIVGKGSPAGDTLLNDKNVSRALAIKALAKMKEKYVESDMWLDLCTYVTFSRYPMRYVTLFSRSKRTATKSSNWPSLKESHISHYALLLLYRCHRYRFSQSHCHWLFLSSNINMCSLVGLLALWIVLWEVLCSAFSRAMGIVSSSLDLAANAFRRLWNFFFLLFDLFAFLVCFSSISLS